MPMKRRAFVCAAATVATAASAAALGAFTLAREDGSGGGPDPAAGDAKPRPLPSSATDADVRAARRLLPRHWDQFTFRALPSARTGRDAFRVSGGEGAILVEGTTAAVRLRGMYWYLAHTARASLTWAGDQLDALPDRLPAVPTPLARSANVPHRFVLNDTNDGYTGPYRDWDYWEREIDTLALHGYNEVLVYAGADAVYHRLFQEFGYSDGELLAWIPGPAHQPWWLLQNMSAFGGPVSRQLLDRRAALGRRICDRLRELGMTPVFPGYFGTVPPGFADRNPGAHLVPQGTWAEFPRPDWLDPRGDHFRRVAAAYYRIHAELFGASTLYKMDLLHEGGDPGDVPVADAVHGVQGALNSAHPEALWAILGWQKNPTKELLGAADRAKVLVLDGLSDRFPEVTDREGDWLGTPYAFGSIFNFGGHTALGANTPDWAALYHSWLGREGSTMSGIALMPEAADNNPVALQLFSELPWTEQSPDLTDWFSQYALSRYGAADRKAAEAWDLLRRSAYGTTRADRWSEPADSLFAARPSLTVTRAASWSPKQLRYDGVELARALDALLDVALALRGSTAYRRDLFDVARQCLANDSRLLLPWIKKAYDDADRAAFDRLTGIWLDRIDLLDLLAATDRDHLLGRWVAEARAWGADDAERDRLQEDALTLLTTWGARAHSGTGKLHDYANREWAGLTRGLYRLRWKTYFDTLAQSLEDGTEPTPVDWYTVERGWLDNPGRLAERAEGDTYKVARQVRDELAREIPGVPRD
ncbi:alpha-N-acetylglucosaminidase [Streptomyces sp. NA04227]|uniref:alpha-N-acetylglucosaminidase n=1 Tax=Streptomyces sp. NA04227 TaxID=2742136 RepID=UPI0015900F79|nr:alpha-N-acetylglucosaminidase [Streptomyces sp. NA04227]QKW07666.1 alpha-N-acetylglucosaminidase [Streptomyces sp. NA04227]